MIQLLISAARRCLAWGAAIVVVVAGAAGASIAGAAGASQMVGFVGAAMVALVPTVVLFGVAAAILDVHEQTRTLALAAAVPRAPAAPSLPSRAASRPVRNGSAGSATNILPTPPPAAPAAPTPGQRPAIDRDEPARPAYCDNPDGWRKLMADAAERGWTSWVSFVGVGFKHRETGREVRLASIREAQAALGLQTIRSALPTAGGRVSSHVS